MKNLFIIHSYNADTKESFGPSLVEEATKLGLNVIFPDFPTKSKANYQKWAEIMDKYLVDGSLNSDSIIVAHSLGTLFTPKYLANRNIPIKLYISCAGFLNDISGRSDLQATMNEFKPNDVEIDRAIRLMENRYSIYSDTDHMNSQGDLERYAIIFQAEKIFIPNIGHLGSDSGIEKLPEATEIIQKVITNAKGISFH